MRLTPWVVALGLSAACSSQSGERGDSRRGPPVTAAGSAGATPRPQDPLPKPGGALAPLPSTPAAVRGAEHPVFVLADNRPLAHVQRQGGLLIVAGRGSVARYLGFGMGAHGLGARRTLDSRTVAPITSKVTIDAPLSPPQAAAGRALRLRVHTQGARKLVARVNQASPVTVGVASGWQTVEVPLPAGALLAGENRLELSGLSGASLDWLQVGGLAAPDDEPAGHVVGQDGALRLPDGGGMAWYVQVPRGARLAGDVLDDGCAVKVLATGEPDDGSGQPAPEIQGELRSPGDAVDLAKLEGRVVRLEVLGHGCPVARLARGALVVPGAAQAVARPKRPRHVILWIMDTLRADRVKPFDDRARAEVPNLERLASVGTVFLNAYSAGNESQVSHASIFLSVVPANHHINPVTGGPWKFDPALTTLGEALKAAGLWGAGFTANGFVVGPAGYGHGLATYTNLMRRDGKRNENYVPAASVLTEALATLARRAQEPFFLFLGTVDSHVPLIAHRPWIDRYDPGPYRGVFRDRVTASGMKVSFMVSRIPPTPRDLQRFVAVYDTTVSYQDQQLGRLLDQLRLWGAADDTMLVITADHGEEFWEEGVGGHGASMRESLVHVPLLIYYPPLFPAARVAEGVETLDVMPTILDALGQPTPPEVQGGSLLPLAQGVGRGYPRPAITSMFEYGHGMRLASWKLRLGPRQSRKLYDLAADPDERRSLTTERPYALRFVGDPMALYVAHRAAWSKRTWGVASNLSPGAAAALD